MYLPSIFEDNFVDSFFDDMFSFPMETTVQRMTSNMSTDVKDLGDCYEMDIELPGYTKENIHAALNQGYLTITASKNEENNTKDEKGRFIRQERYEGQCQRSFYVGEYLTESDIQAGFDNGILKLVFPKEEAHENIEQNRYIPIE
ncbi:MAG: Hsp20/alpha crystallin family protein [Clostridiales bacterium]|nr:Hsp20/alpha crystallin family protein [Clostridiales bacterium]